MSQEKEKPNYYGIMPASVRYDKSLHPNAKILYTEITALSNKEGYCFAKNSYFARLFEVSERSITAWVKNLKEKGYVFTKLIYKENSKEIRERRIYISDPLTALNLEIKGSGGGEENFRGGGEENFRGGGEEGGENNFSTPPEENFSTPPEENFLDNNKKSNTININNLFSSDEEKQEEITKYFLKLKGAEKEVFLKQLWMEEKLNSDYEEFYLHWEGKKNNWKLLGKLHIAIRSWEKRNKQYFPDKHKESTSAISAPVKTKEEIELEEELKKVLEAIVVAVSNKANDKEASDYFKAHAKLIKKNKGYLLKVANKDLLKHQELLNKINVKIEVKSD